MRFKLFVLPFFLSLLSVVRLGAAVGPHGVFVNPPYSGNTNEFVNGAGGVTTIASLLSGLYYGAQYSFAGDIVPTNIRSSNLTAGTNDLFTIPSGKRFLLESILDNTTNLTTGTIYPAAKTNGVYIRFSNSNNISTNLAQNITPTAGSDNFLFEAGETISVVTTLPGANVSVTGLILSTNAGLISPRLWSLTGGNDTVYVCPSGRCAINPIPTGFVSGNPNVQGQYLNFTGTNSVFTVYVVPSGQSPSSSNQYRHGPITTGTLSTFLVACPLYPGDSIVVNSTLSANDQWVKLTIAEIPFP